VVAQKKYCKRRPIKVPYTLGSAGNAENISKRAETSTPFNDEGQEKGGEKKSIGN